MKSKLLATAVIFALMQASMTASAKWGEDRKCIGMESENFTVHSALSKSGTRSLLRHLEAVRSLFQAGQNHGSGSTIPTVIYAIDTSSDFRELGLDPNRIAGMFMPGLRENTVIVRDIPGGEE